MKQWNQSALRRNLGNTAIQHTWKGGFWGEHLQEENVLLLWSAPGEMKTCFFQSII